MYLSQSTEQKKVLKTQEQEQQSALLCAKWILCLGPLSGSLFAKLLFSCVTLDTDTKC